MASATENSRFTGSSRRPGPRKQRNRPRLSVLLLPATVLGALGWVMGMIVMMQAIAGQPAAGDGPRLQASLGLQPLPAASAETRLIAVEKSFRLSYQRVAEERARRMTEMSERLGKREAIAVASVDPARFAAASSRHEPVRLYTEAEAVVAVASPAVADEEGGQGGDTLLTALVDPTQTGSLKEEKTFGLVLAETRAEIETEIGEIPVPSFKPRNLAVSEKPSRNTDRSAAREVAYAKPELPEIDDGKGGKIEKFTGSMSKTAVYVIASGVVIMPNGVRHEAHSGIGKMQDNPKYTHVKMKGATPPGTFHLTMREKLFHGVEALRMTPVDGIAPRNRTGLLTHSYLLGPNGNSHGCVAFKNYKPFLQAFKRGEINRMIVVEYMGDVPKQSKTRTLASLFGG